MRGDLLFFDDLECFFVLHWITLLEYLEVSSTVCHHLDETTTRVVILLMLLQMSCEKVDLFGQHRHLYLLGSRVLGVHLVFFDD